LRYITSRRQFALTIFAALAATLTVAIALLPGGEPTAANPLEGITSVSAGGNHTCAVTQAGAALCWGDNHYGQLGDGTTVDRARPVEVTGLSSGVAAIAASYNHTCAVLDSGGVQCWGYNRYGQLGNPANVGNQASTNPAPLDVTGLQSGVSDVTVGAAHSCALLDTGGVKCWGWDFAGQLGDGPSCGAICSTPRDVTGLTSGVAAVDAGLYHTCAALSSGGVKCWGQNDFGQLGAATGSPCFYVTLEPLACSFTPVDVAGLANAVSVAAGGVYDGANNASHTCALLAAGGVKCWGANSSGQLGDGQACGMVCQTPAGVTDLNGDALTGAGEVDVGAQHTCARRANDGAVLCWGENVHGQIGDGDMPNDRARATEICAGLTCEALTGVAAISLGLNHGCALLDSSLICWGSNSQGQLGDGSGCGASCDTPVHVALSKGGLPDLAVQTMRIELETGGSCAYTIALGTRVEFRNIGTGDAGPFVVEVNGVQQTFSGGLAAGASGSLWFASYHYGEPTTAVLDATSLVMESDETNNSHTKNVPVPTLPPTCTPTQTSTPVAPTVTPTPQASAGDANCDHTVNSIDAALVLQRVAGLLSMLQCAAAADANHDGRVDSIDAALILQFVAGLLAHL
jgi:alpha-tubulin suppressor-like RCC1 family protein